jgi:hypothetical protein
MQEGFLYIWLGKEAICFDGSGISHPETVFYDRAEKYGVLINKIGLATTSTIPPLVLFIKCMEKKHNKTQEPNF